MKFLQILSLLLLTGFHCLAQSSTPNSPFNTTYWGVVLEHPEMKNVKVQKDIPFLQDDKASLNMDIYLPPDLKAGEKRPAVIFLNAIGESATQPKVKTWGIYRTWPQLLAAHGIIGISMDTDRNRIQESIQGIFKFLEEKGGNYQVDADRLGVYAASANVTQSAIYLMKEDAYHGIKAAVLYYGSTPQGPYRKDLPLLFVVAESDVARNGYTTLWQEVLKNNAPWTIKMATGLPHAFDAFADNDEARKIVKETISFWKNHLEPVQQPSWAPSIPRAVLAAQYGRDSEKVLSTLEQWLASNPNDIEGLFQYAVTFKNLGRYEESEKAFRRILAIQPDHVPSLTYMFTIMHALGRPQEAEPFIARAEKTGKIDKNTYLGLGMTMYTAKNYKDGVRFFKKLVAMDPSATNLYNLACGYAMMNEKDKAFENLNKAAEHGYTVKANYESDTDLESLKTDVRWNTLMLKLEPAEGNTPHKRAHHEMVYDEVGKSIWMISGSTPLNGGESFRFFNDIWKYNGSEWTKTGVAGDERSGIRLAFDTKRNKLYSFGGFTKNNQSSGQLRVFENGEWKVLADTPEMKAAEAGFVYDADRDRFVAFGESIGGTWEWDGNSWKKFEGIEPDKRQAFAMVYDTKRKRTVLFGGSGANRQKFGDTWEFDGKEWTKVSDSGPGARMAFGYAYDSKRGLLLIFGGIDQNGVKGDTWGWNGNEWKKLAESGPAPRMMGYMAYDKGRDKIVLFGGRLGWPNDVNDTWEWDGVKWEERK